MSSGLRARKTSTGTDGDDPKARRLPSGRTILLNDPAPKLGSQLKTRSTVQAPPAAQQRKGSVTSVLPPPAPKRARSPADDQNQAVISARYWRGRAKLMEQRSVLAGERNQRLVEKELLSQVRMDTKERATGYEHLVNEIASLQGVLTLFNMQGPNLPDLIEEQPTIKTRLEAFTKALEQFLSWVTSMDAEAVNIPKTSAETGAMSDNVGQLSLCLIKLTHLLGAVEDTDEKKGNAMIVNALGHMLVATQLFFNAYGHFKENKALMEKAARLKQTEKFLNCYLSQMIRAEEVPR